MQSLSGKFLVFVFLFSSLYLYAQNQSKKYVITYTKDGKPKDSTITIKDTGTQNLINAMMNGSFNPKDSRWQPPKNDTIFNKQGLPETVKLGVTFFGATIEKLEFDSLRRLVKITGYDSTGKTSPYFEDRAMETYKYDSAGKKIEERYFDKFLKPNRLEITGPAIIRYKYDTEGRLAEELYFDENDKPLSDWALTKYSYDSRGKLISKQDYNAKGEKVK